LPPIPEPVLRGHPFFAGLDPSHLDLLARHASGVAFTDGAFLFREGQPAETFFLINGGSVALEVAAPGRGPVVIQTIGDGEVAGFSWLLEPHRWEFDGRAIGAVAAVRVDGAGLRAKCTADPLLGYELMRRFARLATRRLQATRMQILDVYGHAGTR